MQKAIQDISQLSSLATQMWEQHGQGAVIFALIGPLGAGKTAFTKALAKAVGVTDDVTSPTFVIHGEYRIPNSERRFNHIDAWRMETVQELDQLNLPAMLARQDVVVIEWADKFKEDINKLASQARIVWITFDYGDTENERIVRVEDFG